MSSSFEQAIDLSGDGVAIEFSEDDQAWTIDTGVLVSSSRTSAVNSDFTHSTLLNFGTLFSPTDTAVTLLADDGFISNAAGARIIGAVEGVYLHGANDVLENGGTILGLTDVGVLLATPTSSIVDNAGTIFGRPCGVLSNSTVGRSTIHNAGVIASAQVGIEVDTAAGLTTAITNAAGAVIRSDGGEAIDSTQGRITLDNRGTVAGAIRLAVDDAANDVIGNHGRITSRSALGDGNDLFNGAAGIQGPISGEDGNDHLIGGRGKDAINGGAGLDLLTGGAGRDQFIFSGASLNAATNVDRITDFAPGIDAIVLAQDVFTKLPAPGMLAASHFHIGPAAADASDRIIYNPNTAFLFYDADGSGGAGEIHFATLAAHLSLHASDFLVIT